MVDDMVSEGGRRARFEQWEKLGLDRVKGDLEDGGWRVVGGTPAVRDLAWEWVRMKEVEIAAAAGPQKPAEVLTLRPSIYGVGIDLKELVRRGVKWWCGKDE